MRTTLFRPHEIEQKISAYTVVTSVPSNGQCNPPMRKGRTRANVTKTLSSRVKIFTSEPRAAETQNRPSPWGNPASLASQIEKHKMPRKTKASMFVPRRAQVPCTIAGAVPCIRRAAGRRTPARSERNSSRGAGACLPLHASKNEACTLCLKAPSGYCMERGGRKGRGDGHE